MREAPLDADLPGASYPLQPRPFTLETTFGFPAQTVKIDTGSRHLDGRRDAAGMTN